MLQTIRSASGLRLARPFARVLPRAAIHALARVAQDAPHALPSGLVAVPRRSYATPPPQIDVRDDFPIEKYHDYSDATMETMLESLENLLDGAGDSECEVDYSSGVLTLKLGEHGTYVINKQPPNKQIWLSSPTSGPKRYGYVPEADQWRYSRDNSSLGELLNTELSQIFGQDVDLKINKVADCL
ncbi:hypothetical protein PHLGIDRAFT_475931 [Phlebiopsis gigantea 11061_1 CR5-6]|uniref:ferroxidase n=1 Tax=Phlebiopsis gigantea (strain 11061_1 CR5-6) TaxID=745531 RepID=A0A0C3S5U1_PHLG1|nr:hypothetical protein PHLGIDRAFT_475931 [Phlebiopsis gigantea 11061_1 CR5-6]